MLVCLKGFGESVYPLLTYFRIHSTVVVSSPWFIDFATSSRDFNADLATERNAAQRLSFQNRN